MPCLPQWKLDRLNAKKAKLEELIPQLETAIKFLILNPTKQYTLTTGQTTQQVTRSDLSDLRKYLAESEAAMDDILEGLYCGGPGSVVIARPGF